LSQLTDFASPAAIADDDPSTLSHPITIPSSALYEFLTRTEAEVRKRACKEEDTPKARARKRQRTKTPLEELESDDERRLVEEERAAKRVAGDDGDYMVHCARLRGEGSG
jgi:hypothetical protein